MKPETIQRIKKSLKSGAHTYQKIIDDAQVSTHTLTELFRTDQQAAGMHYGNKRRIKESEMQRIYNIAQRRLALGYTIDKAMRFAGYKSCTMYYEAKKFVEGGL